MLSTAIVIFREVLEIAIILSVVIAATNGLKGRSKWIWAGIFAGLAGSALVAIFARTISNAAEGMGQELFNAGILLTAAIVIGGTALWMSKHAREMTKRIKVVSTSVIDGELPFYSIAIVIALAIVREGAEIVLFTYGMIASGQSLNSIFLGSAIGFVGGGLVGGALYAGLITMSHKHIFQVTTWLLIFLCAGMASTAAKYLVSAGHFETLTAQIWDTSFILSDNTIIGEIMHILFGYTDQPMQIQAIFYVSALVLLIGSKYFINKKT